VHALCVRRISADAIRRYPAALHARGKISLERVLHAQR
jgi:hypothetical protein